ncbi:MAG: MBL fold metallo-hydrolase [Euryarchaeota archaeon]|nr:MBL fold metallo-hydrolase [Euryarchaeota archaeon]MBV1730223.1 MBL fold metallo-hydrolase [Methanobacterium sp.]MBU4547743.1 MBL fold metallo-hydrolase [Euryarchaeota archaeon]MBU4608930.1 MBL fold metallo-hydrolase [Euryarchaeota archaeon]MBV1755436.1 MBL fold metallo-hydrolase [Methanobacterium sp.]
MEKINDVFFIEGYGYDSNMYLIGDVLVDTGTGNNKEYLFSQLKMAGTSPGDISCIVNTHCHYDHVGGNSLFSAEIAIHELDAPAMESGDQMTTVSYMFGKSLEPVKIDHKLKEGNKIGDFKIIHTPGHTPGGICLWDGEILISGDTVFANGGFGRLDVGGNQHDMQNSINKLKDLGVEYLLPGHGPWVDNGQKHLELAYNMIKRF